jgi:DNA-binding winged helix-turn-helix (wHTH) protein
MSVNTGLEDEPLCILNDRLAFRAERETLTGLDGCLPVMMLGPVAVRTLSALIYAPNIVLSRRELFAMVWQAYGQEACDEGLDRVMCILRRAFEALDPGEPYIRAIPRIGYALLARVGTMADPDPMPARQPYRENRSALAPTPPEPLESGHAHSLRHLDRLIKQGNLLVASRPARLDKGGATNATCGQLHATLLGCLETMHVYRRAWIALDSELARSKAFSQGASR